MTNKTHRSSTGDSLHDLANQILKSNSNKLTIQEGDASTLLNSEEIHIKRVAIRRLRAALKSFKKILPGKAKKNRVELQRVSRILGKMRDLDVFFEFIHNTVEPKPLLGIQRERSQRKVLSLLKSKHYTKLVESLEQIKTLKTTHPILNVASHRITKAIDKVLEKALDLNPEVDEKFLHQLRISIKKLRYNCEFFEPIITPYISSFGSYIEKLKKIQDVLGDHQDAITGISMIVRYKSQFSVKEFLQIKKAYERKKMRTRQAFFKMWKES